MTPAQSATVEEQREIARALTAAYDAGRLNGGAYSRAMRMWAVGAYLDALLVMMPEGWFLSNLYAVVLLGGHDRGYAAILSREGIDDHTAVEEAAATPALAVLTAIERSYEHG